MLQGEECTEHGRDKEQGALLVAPEPFQGPPQGMSGTDRGLLCTESGRFGSDVNCYSTAQRFGGLSLVFKQVT